MIPLWQAVTVTLAASALSGCAGIVWGALLTAARMTRERDEQDAEAFELAVQIKQQADARERMRLS